MPYALTLDPRVLSTYNNVRHSLVYHKEMLSLKIETDFNSVEDKACLSDAEFLVLLQSIFLLGVIPEADYADEICIEEELLNCWLNCDFPDELISTGAQPQKYKEYIRVGLSMLRELLDSELRRVLQ